MTTQRRATLHDDEEDDDGDDDAAISGWEISDFDATIFAHATAAVADRRFPPKPKPAPAVASHQTTNEQQQQQQHDKQKIKKTLRESDAKSPCWNSEALRLAENSHSRTSSSIKIPKAQLVTTQITTSKTHPGHNNNNHPSSIHNNRTNNHHSNNNISKTALVSREFAVSGYAVPTKLLRPKELSPNRRRDRRRPPHNLQQQQQQTEPTKGGSICKIVRLIDDDEEQEDTNLWRLPPALRRIEAFRQHHTHPKYRENTFLLPPLLHGSNSVNSLLLPLFRSDLERKMKALSAPFGSHPIGQSPVVAATNTPLLNGSSDMSEQLQQQQEHYSSMRRSHQERQA